jgi:DNA-binding transcriptional ArsR family regulator
LRPCARPLEERRRARPKIRGVLGPDTALAAETIWAALFAAILAPVECRLGWRRMTITFAAQSPPHVGAFVFRCSSSIVADAAVLHRCAEPTIVNLMVQYPTTVDRAFAALADPTRRAVLERLGSGRATISELAEPFGMSLTGMKKHIRLLEEAQLVTTEKVGRVRRCMLAPYAFEGISTWLQRLDRFAQVVERTKGDR